MSGRASSNANASRSFGDRLANLSTFLTLVAILGVGYGAARKLDNIAATASADCRAVSAAMIVSLEASRITTPRRGLHNLDRALRRFERVESNC